MQGFILIGHVALMKKITPNMSWYEGDFGSFAQCGSSRNTGLFKAQKAIFN